MTEEEVTKELSKQLAEEIDKDILNEFTGKVLPGNKADVDPEYLFNIKRKVEKLLDSIIAHYGVEELISDRYHHRVDMAKMCNSKYFDLFNEKKDLNGNQLRYGHDIIPQYFEDWLQEYLPDLMSTQEIYSNMCEYRRIRKEDLKELNKIAKRYKVNVHDNSSEETN